MDLLLNDPYAYLDVFLLVFIRVLGLTLIAPFFGNRSVPYMAKVSLTLFTSLMVITVIDVDVAVSSSDVVGFAVAAIIEFLTGFAIGFGIYMVFSILSLAGQFIDAQIGFSMVNVFDPMSQIQLTITGNLYYYILIIITIVTNAHHRFLRGLIDSFYLIPLGKMALTPGFREATVDYFTRYFSIALQVAAPIFFVMIITNVVLGILARTVPQLNMFVIGFPIKIMFGLLTIYIMLSMFANISDMLIHESEQVMRDMLEGMRPR